MLPKLWICLVRLKKFQFLRLISKKGTITVSLCRRCKSISWSSSLRGSRIRRKFYSWWTDSSSKSINGFLVEICSARERVELQVGFFHSISSWELDETCNPSKCLRLEHINSVFWACSPEAASVYIQVKNSKGSTECALQAVHYSHGLEMAIS